MSPPEIRDIVRRLRREKKELVRLANYWRFRHNRMKYEAQKFRGERDSLRKELRGAKTELRRLETKHKKLRLCQGPA